MRTIVWVWFLLWFAINFNSLLALSLNEEAKNWLWEAKLDGFSQSDYQKAISRLWQDFECRTQQKVRPGAMQRVGLKVYSRSGAGVATPQALVRAVIAELEHRGFARQNIFIIDEAAAMLRQAGFLPKLSANAPDQFAACPVLALDCGHYYDATWFYESPLPTMIPPPAFYVNRKGKRFHANDRYSYLPMPLLQGIDFWINLPMGLDNRAVGVVGAIMNASLYNVSNNNRFFQSPATAAAAAAEIAAIPELHQRCLFTLLTLERYQFIGGPIFNSLYTASEPVLVQSANATAVDQLLLQRMNKQRSQGRFPLLNTKPTLLTYAEQTGLGQPESLKTIKLEGGNQ